MRSTRGCRRPGRRSPCADVEAIQARDPALARAAMLATWMRRRRTMRGLRRRRACLWRKRPFRLKGVDRCTIAFWARRASASRRWALAVCVSTIGDDHAAIDEQRAAAMLMRSSPRGQLPGQWLSLSRRQQRALCGRLPRANRPTRQVLLTTKMLVRIVEKPDDYDRLFEEQRERFRTDHSTLLATCPARLELATVGRVRRTTGSKAPCGR